VKAIRTSRRPPACGKREGRAITFVFEGRRLSAREGDSVAAALIANDVHVFGRSSKYHRPRGYRCGHGHCSCCSMRVDGLPGVRTCVTAVRPGMTVAREHAWPGAEHDLLRGAELLSPLMPPGFYYRWFRRSPRAFSVFERSLAHVAGQGRLPDAAAAARMAAATCERRHVDVLVVGGGVAGMSAAIAAADGGAATLLVESDGRLGGRLADATRVLGVSASSSRESWATGAAIVERLATDVLRHERIAILTDADAIGWYEEGTVAVDRRPDLLLVDPSAVVLATGGYELGLPFPNCDLPGIILASGAQRLTNRYGLHAGSRAAFLTRDDFGYMVAAQTMAADIEVVCIADTRCRGAIDKQLASRLADEGVQIVTGVDGARAGGFSRVSSLSLRLPGDDEKSGLRFRCDFVCVSAGMRPADDLAYQARCHGSVALTASSPAAKGEDRPRHRGPRGPWLAGLVAGADSPSAAIAQGEAAGRAAVQPG
jgi:sarcosine oxidase, subunit alpha